MLRSLLVLSVPLAFFAPQSTPYVVTDVGDVSLTDASAAEVDRQVTTALAAQARMRSGRWKLKTETRIRMRRSFGEPAYERPVTGIGSSFVTTLCVTKEQAETDAHLFTHREPGESPCRYDRFVLRGGTLDSAMWCPSESDRILFTTHGDFSPNGFVVETDFVSEWGHKARTKTTGIRIGDCRE